MGEVGWEKGVDRSDIVVNGELYQTRLEWAWWIAAMWTWRSWESSTKFGRQPLDYIYEFFPKSRTKFGAKSKGGNSLIDLSSFWEYTKVYHIFIEGGILSTRGQQLPEQRA